MTPEERALEAIGSRLGDLTNELMDAALGRNDFEDLALATRVNALMRLMEWRLGKPASVKPLPAEDSEAPPAHPQTGDDLFE
jgi:hypothetical protein